MGRKLKKMKKMMNKNFDLLGLNVVVAHVVVDDDNDDRLVFLVVVLDVVVPL